MSTICLDFGTAWCKAAQYLSEPGQAFRPEAVRVLPLGRQDGVVLATALRVVGDRVLVGPDALAVDAAAKAGAHGRLGAPYLSFKTLLSAPDLPRVLLGTAPARYNAHGSFSQRDLVVLYLGFALHRMRDALGLSPHEAVPPFRFTYPAWGLGNDRRRELGALFNEGAFLAQDLAGAYDDPAGLALDSVHAALKRAMAGAAPVVVGAVFEAGAAACARMLLEPGHSEVLLVVDIGAGTTDFGAFGVRNGQVTEIRPARKTIDLAGDTVDNALLNLLIERAKHVKGATAQGVLWRELSPHVRRLKERLFAEGRAAVRYGGGVVHVQAAELERHVGYRAFVDAVKQGYVQTLAAIDSGLLAGSLNNGLTVVMSGGGAALPFLARMVARARPRKASKLRITAAPLCPAWCMEPCFEGQLAPVFSQVSVAIGGALAGEQLVVPSVEPPPLAAP